MSFFAPPPAALFNSYGVQQGSFVGGTLYDRFGHDTGARYEVGGGLRDRYGYDIGLRVGPGGGLVDRFGHRTDWSVR